MKISSGFVCVMLVVFAIICAASCGGGSNDNKSAFDISSAAGPVTIYGKVIDASNRKPIAGASVKLLIKDQAITTETAAEDNAEEKVEKILTPGTGSATLPGETGANGTDDSSAAQKHEAGYFEFSGIAAGRHKLKIEASGYAVYEKWLDITSTGDALYLYAVGDNGNIELDMGCGVDVYVSTEDGILPNAYVYATGPDMPEIGSQTDASGKATLAGLSQIDNYAIVVVASDTNSDGIYDYQTGTSSSYSCANSDKSLSLFMPKAERNDSIALIGGSYQKYNTIDTYSGQLGAGTDEPLVLVFNYPVSVGSEGIQLTYYRDLVPFADPQFGKNLIITANSELSAGNTVLTITPVDPLIINESYWVVGGITAQIYGNVSYWYSYTDFYVFNPNGISNDTFVWADNLNGTTRIVDTAKTVYLKFPEYVYGQATIKSYTKNGAVVTMSPMMVDIGNGYISTDERTLGCTNGTCKDGNNVFYYVSLSSSVPQLDNNAVGSENNVTIYINATDYEGNRLQKEFVLPIE